PAGAPALVVDYSPEWSGINVNSTKPRTLFAGIRFDFDARFVLPEGAPFDLVVKSVRGPDLWKWKNTSVPLADFEQQVYDAMMDRAFEDLRKRLSDAFLHGRQASQGQ
ncbi:MAG TPA: hypothetical protein VE987_21450, partial [Polyangiaceae bacterium]|nr:hypothetical protein [Polyangiaceae bacterium]